VLSYVTVFELGAISFSNAQKPTCLNRSSWPKTCVRTAQYLYFLHC